jgi:hypothetical protein
MPEYLTPGVYIEEVSRGPKPIEGVSTSTAGFLGETERGRTKPTLVDSFAEFTRVYGSRLAEERRYLVPAVEGFFRNGGQRCYVGRVTASTETATATPGDETRPRPGELRPSTYSLSFDGVVAGHEASETVELTNLGDPSAEVPAEADPSVEVAAGDLTLEDPDGVFTAELVDAGGNAVDPADVAPGEVGRVRVTFAPDAPGESEGQLTVAYSDEQPSVPITLSAAAVAASEGALGAPDSVSFGRVVTGHERGDSVTVTNLGNPDAGHADLTVRFDDVAVDPTDVGFAVQSYTHSADGALDPTAADEFVLGPGESVTVDVAFAPADVGRQEATLTVPNDDGSATTEVALVGTGTEPTASSLGADPETVDFNALPVGHVATREVTLTNLGDPSQGHPPLTVRRDDVVLSGEGGEPVAQPAANAPGFTVTLEAPDGTAVNAGESATVQPGESAAVRIQFRRGGVAGQDLRLSVTDADGNATLTVPVVASGVVMAVAAVGPGRWGQRIALTFEDASLYRAGTNQLFKLTVSYWSDDVTVSDAKRLGDAFSLSEATPPTEQEVYDNLSPDESSADYYRDRINDASNLVAVTPQGSGRPPTGGTTWLAGSFGAADPQVGLLDFRGDADADPGDRTGLAAFEELRDVSIVSIPDEHSYGDYLLTADLVAHCEQPNLKDRVAVLQSPPGPFQSEGFDGLDSKYAAYYYPWVVIRDPTTSAKKLVPPGGHVAGIYARSDTERGVHKAPANEVVRGVVELPFEITDGDQAALNPQGVNCIRSFRGRGIRLWGARTVSSDPEWKYVNVRRLFIYIEQSIDRSTQWVVFEPNNEQLWARVRQTVANFLNTVWRDGALMGTTPEEAYYVKCDRSTMTQADIDNGKLIVEIGVAPTKPAEFVVFRISQWTGGAEGA